MYAGRKTYLLQMQCKINALFFFSTYIHGDLVWSFSLCSIKLALHVFRFTLHVPICIYPKEKIRLSAKTAVDEGTCHNSIGTVSAQGMMRIPLFSGQMLPAKPPWQNSEGKKSVFVCLNGRRKFLALCSGNWSSWKVYILCKEQCTLGVR